MSELSKIFFLVKKDFYLFFRKSIATIFGFSFTLAVLATFCFAQLILVDVDKQILSLSALWLCFVFIAIHVFSVSIKSEKKAFASVLLSDLKISSYFISKLISILSVLVLVSCLLAMFFEIFFQFNFVNNFFRFIFVFLFTSIGIASSGVLFSTLVSKIQNQEVSLPIILFPLYIPIVIIGIELSRNIVFGQAFDFFWLVSILSVNTIVATMSWCLFDKAVRS